MADDEEARRLDPEAAVAPNRDRRGEPVTIEGEATATTEEPKAETAAEPAEATGESPTEATPESPSETTAESKAEEPAAQDAPAEEPPLRAEEPTPPRRPSVFFAAGVGGIVGALVAAAILWFEGSTAGSDVSQKLATAEASIQTLSGRIAALETSAQDAKSATDAAKTSQSDAQAARSDADKALALATKTAAVVEQQQANATSATPAPAASPSVDTSALEARVQKLESALPASDKPADDKPAVDLSPLENRLTKVEAALAAPKIETRVAPEENHARQGETAAAAVAAEAIAERLTSGAPYPSELTALERVGADPAKIAALKPFAEKGAPTAAALASSFDKVAPDALKAANAKESGGVMDRLMSNMGKVVKITPVGETAGDDPSAIVSQIAASLDRGHIDDAMALWARLPEPSRRASQDWANSAQARLAADAAAQDVLNDAMTKLASSEK
jgi:hypothetical protein